MRVDIMGVGFDDLTVDEAVAVGYNLLCGADTSYIVTPNPEIVYESFSDSGFKDILNSAGLVLADGVGITLAAKILRTPMKGRVTGIGFADGLMKKMQAGGQKLFLFGGGPGRAEAAGLNLLKKYPGLTICGVADGYFKDDGEILVAINSSEADCVFVCLGSPKQEKWMAERSGAVQAKLLVGLGGSIDIFAGDVKRAPVAMQKLGLEWLYRLVKEPSRFKRMLRLPKFLFAVIRREVRKNDICSTRRRL